MRILHFSDIHLGRRIAGCNMDGEYKSIFEEIISHASGCDADLVTICGDLLERGADSKAEALLISFLLRLSENGNRPVVALAGASDDKERLDAFKEALWASNIFLVTEAGEKIPLGQKAAASGKGYVVLETSRGRACVAFLPYFESGADYKTEVIKYTEGAIKGFSPKHINIFAAYLGTEDAVCDDGRASLPQSVLPEADYIALGGCHKTQLLDHGRSIIYSGSLLGDDFEESKNKEKNAKKIIAAQIEKESEVKKSVIKLAASKPLVRLTASSPEQAMSQLADMDDCLISVRLNMSVPLSIVEYKSLKAAHIGVMEIVLDMPPKVIKERYRVLRAGSAAELFRNFYRTRFDAEPSRELVAAFAKVAQNVDFSVNGNARLDSVDLKNILQSKEPNRLLAKMFYLDEFAEGVLREIKYAEQASQKELENIEEEALAHEIDAINEEIALANAQLERASVAKGILPEFEKAVLLEKDLRAAVLRLERLKKRQKDISEVFEQARQSAPTKDDIEKIRQDIERGDKQYAQKLADLRTLEKDLSLTERTIDMQMRSMEKPVISSDAIALLSQAVIYEEAIKIYTESISKMEKRISDAEIRIAGSQKSLAAFSKAEQDLTHNVTNIKKNIMAFAPAEAEVEGVLAALQKNHREIEAGIEKVKDIAAQIKSLLAENESETQKLKDAMEGISEQSRLLKQQQDLIAGTEHRIEKLYKKKEEQIGINIFTQIGNSLKEKDECPLCGEIVHRNPTFGEVNTNNLDSDIEDAKEQLREAFDHRDKLSLALKEKEQIRDNCKKRLEEIMESLKSLKAARVEILRADDDVHITERIAASNQNIAKVYSLLKNLEESRTLLSAAERKVMEETGSLAVRQNSLAAMREQHAELASKMADAVFAYNKLKTAIGRDDLKRIEAEITEDLKKRGNILQDVVTQEGVRISTLNALRQAEKSLTETESKQAVAEERLKMMEQLQNTAHKTEEVWKQLQAELTSAESEVEALRGKILDQKNLCIGIMIAGNFKNATDIKKSVSYEITAAFALKTLEERRKRILRELTEMEERIQEAKEQTLPQEMGQIKEMFASGELYSVAAEEYFAETATEASQKMAALTKGQYNIEYQGGFVTVDNFAGGRKEAITELSDTLKKAFDLVQ